jgi:hypothetical protein
MSLVAGLLQPRLFSSKLSKLKAAEKNSGSATGTTCVVDNSGKFSTGVKDNAGKFATGVINTGGN